MVKKSEQKSPQSKHVRTAISVCGNQMKLAELVGVGQGCVSKWVRGKQKVHPRHAILIGTATEGVVTKEMLCPDIFPPAVKRRKAG